MIVVDTNVLVYFFTLATQSDDVALVREKDPDWHAPLLWRSEFRNAIAGYIRRGDMSMDQAIDTLQKAERLMHNKEHMIDSTAVMRLVADSACSAYDCEFVALANHLNIPLVTSDSRLLRNFPDRALAPDQFLA